MTGTDVAVAPQTRSVIRSMAERYGMEPAAFEATVRATCMPTGRDVAPMTREEFAAGIMVAEKYTLNPILREIYFYPRKGGGIVPVVSVDGWLSLINRRKELDGIEFDELHDDKGKLVSITCRIYRNDRKHATIVTEYLSECWRDTAPWKMPHRMLRHKALIQCARYAFGFSGIHDEDEAERIVAAVNAEAGPPAPPPAPPSQQVTHQRQEPPAPPAGPETVEEAEVIEQNPESIRNEMEESYQEASQSGALENPEPFDFEPWIEEVRGVLAGCQTEQDVDEAHEVFGDTAEGELSRQQRDVYEDLHTAALDRVKNDAAAAANAHREAVSREEQDEGEGDIGFPGDAAIKALQDAEKPPEKSRAELHVEELRDALNDPARTPSSLGNLWNSTKPLRTEFVKSGEMSKAARAGLHQDFTAEVVRLQQAAAGTSQDAGPPAPPPAAEPPAPPAPPAADGQSLDDRAKAMADALQGHAIDTEFDAAFMETLKGVDTVDLLNTFAPMTLKKRNSFGSDNPLRAKWMKAITDRRNKLNGL